MTKKTKILLISGVLLAAGILAWILFGKEATPRISVKTTEALLGSITREVTATGTLEPINQVEVGTQVSGVIEKIYVDYNSVVKKGQVLAALDKSMLEAQVAEVKASLESAENDLEFQQKNHERYRQLYAKKTISEADYENAWYTFVKARTNVDRIRAELTRTDRNLGYATITSPIDGVVLSRAVEEGQTVAASFNTPTLFTIANDMTRMRVIADVDEADIGQIKEGQRVTFTVDAFPDDIFNGTVTQVRLEPHINANVVTYSVVVEAPNPDLKLMPGLTASLTVITEEKQGVVLIPSGALTLDPESTMILQYNESQGMPDNLSEPPSGLLVPSGRLVFVLQDGLIQPRSVATGMDNDVHVEICSGIQLGDNVVIAIEETHETDTSPSGSTSSPFLPKPPGSNKQSPQQEPPKSSKP
ncbi:MAG: efflux RND transporter periplasmic adaptor subunit [Bacteroidales bacterium]|nr:efflux RND transporter periplasmic adaptor subunit [Bacteroidales bacterium]